MSMNMNTTQAQAAIQCRALKIPLKKLLATAACSAAVAALRQLPVTSIARPLIPACLPPTLIRSKLCEPWMHRAAKPSVR